MFYHWLLPRWEEKAASSTPKSRAHPRDLFEPGAEEREGHVRRQERQDEPVPEASEEVDQVGVFRCDLGDLYAESGQILQGSFSAVSKPNFTRINMWTVNTRWNALAEIYTMHSFAPFWNP